MRPPKIEKGWYAKLVAANVRKKPPAGAFTAADFARDIGESRTAAKSKLMRLVESGEVCRAGFTMPTGGKVFYYWGAEA